MKPETRQAIERFRNQLQDHGAFDALFEHIPDVCFFVKDRKMRLMMANQACLQLLGQHSMDTVVGRTGDAFFPKAIADAFHKDDRQVLEEQIPLHERVELMLEDDGKASWYCTTKLPLYAEDGSVAGLMGITRPLRSADPQLNPFARMMPVIDHIRQNLRSQLTISDLARICHLSPSQTRRRFRNCFGQSPLQFILRLRVQAACNLLVNSTLSIGEVAERSGFPDQSYFTRQFRRIVGMSPRDYRKERGG
jgi:PAS domain S-box-containing protein